MGEAELRKLELEWNDYSAVLVVSHDSGAGGPGAQAAQEDDPPDCPVQVLVIGFVDSQVLLDVQQQEGDDEDDEGGANARAVLPRTYQEGGRHQRPHPPEDQHVVSLRRQFEPRHHHVEEEHRPPEAPVTGEHRP